MGSLTRQQVLDEIVQGGQSLVPFIGSIGKWFRPSGTDVPGQVILDEAGVAGYAYSIGYDVDSTDNKDPGPATVIAEVKAGIHPGAIVSMHFGHQGTITALPAILDHMAALGIAPVTLTTMLG
jgi:peptidoglycan/xylan/chitin deacetylase (PgdA/CDA1 family)